MWVDTNDSMNSMLSVLPKDMNNLVQGVQSFGFSEALLYTETQLYEFWLLCAEDCGMGLGYGLLASAFITRLFFTPPIIYSVSLPLLFSNFKFL